MGALPSVKKRSLLVLRLRTMLLDRSSERRQRGWPGGGLCAFATLKGAGSHRQGPGSFAPAVSRAWNRVLCWLLLPCILGIFGEGHLTRLLEAIEIIGGETVAGLAWLISCSHGMPGELVWRLWYSAVL